MTKFNPLLPVLDLRGGQVVHAVAGRRREYRQLESRLVSTAEPVPVAKALARAAGTQELYVADLDALAGHAPDWESHRALAQAGFQLWLDAGLDPWLREEFPAGPARWILPLESLGTPEDLRRYGPRARQHGGVFSLDLMNGRPMNAASVAHGDWLAAATEAGFRSLLILDLAAVGSASGPATLELCQEVKSRYPHLELVSGGGVRGPADVRAFAAAGVDRVLVASALHAGVSLETAIRIVPPGPDFPRPPRPAAPA